MEALVKPTSATSMLRGDFYRDVIRPLWAAYRNGLLRGETKKRKIEKLVDDMAFDVDGGEPTVIRKKRRRAFGSGSREPKMPDPMSLDFEKLVVGSSYLELVKVREFAY